MTMEVYGFDDGKYGRPKFDDGSSCSPFLKLLFYGYTMVYPMFRRIHFLQDPSSPWKRRHESLPTQRPAHFLHRRLCYLGKMELIWAGFFKTGTWGMCLQFWVGKLFRSPDGNWGDFDKYKCWANQKLWFWQAKSRPFSYQKCGCLPTRITEGVQPSESIRMASSGCTK